MHAVNKAKHSDVLRKSPMDFTLMKITAYDQGMYFVTKNCGTVLDAEGFR